MLIMDVTQRMTLPKISHTRKTTFQVHLQFHFSRHFSHVIYRLFIKRKQKHGNHMTCINSTGLHIHYKALGGIEVSAAFFSFLKTEKPLK